MAATPDEEDDDLRVSLNLLHPLMADVERKLRRFCCLPSPEAYAAVTVWIAATHVAALLRSAPGLVVTAPMGRSARSRLLSVVSAMTRKPLVVTPAAGRNDLDLYRTANEIFDPATVFIDDAEVIFNPRVRGSKKDLRTFVESCHTRGLFAVRMSSGEELRPFALVCTVAGQPLPAEVEDRAVVVRMDAGEDQDLGWFRRRDVSELVTASDLLTMWADQNMGDILEFLEAWVDRPANEFPLRMKDHAAETWEPLFAIADLAGHDWLDRIVEAARTLDGQYQSEKRQSSFAKRLLIDLRESLSEGAWADYNGFIGTEDAVELLSEDPQGHWRAAGLTPTKLSRTMRTLGLKSRRDSSGTRRGFQIGELRKFISSQLDASDASDASDGPFLRRSAS